MDKITIKRVFDMLCALVLLVMLAPLVVIIVVAVKSDGGTIFYLGRRVGLLGEPFLIYKFRTMVQGADKTGGSSTPDGDVRVTTVGRFLRRYKLDEIPQLINVLLGNMSLVGPRPQVEWAVKLYNENERRLLSVRPGITDYASIVFRNEGEILKGSKDPDRDYLEKIAPEKIRLGLKYVDNHNLWIDLKIIAATIRAVIFG